MAVNRSKTDIGNLVNFLQMLHRQLSDIGGGHFPVHGILNFLLDAVGEKTIKGEFAQNGVNNPLKHVTGVISMARSSHPDSASMQFFIMHADAPFLDGQYAAFGSMIEGFDLLEELGNVPTDETPGRNNPPLTPVVMKTVRVEAAQ